ncbi:hypothetical protein U9M48_036438 [Paspalum notatum var. saurae]|uniref:Uncharacterized protein n=1 Tax=Paspalum notatum var. saurae TaxID=547442 RepID=A0AAQ3UD58_PASNO
MVVPSLNRPRQATPDPLSVLALLEDEQKFKLGGYQNAHKIDENMPRIEYVAHCQSGQVGRPHHQVGRPRGAGRLTH